MIDYVQSFIREIEAFIEMGGPILWCMLVLCVMMYGMIVSTWWGAHQLKNDIRSLDRKLERDEAEEQVLTDISIFELDRLAWVERRLPMIAVMVALAPLAGLLGTVSGMLATFSGMASADTKAPIESISAGISEALVTTQLGLFMAIPGAIIFTMLKGRVSLVHGELERFEHARIISMRGGVHG